MVYDAPAASDPNPTREPLRCPSSCVRPTLKPRPRELQLAAQSSYRIRVRSGVALGYRRTEDTFGTWSVIVADGGGNEQLKKFGNADDREVANGKTVLSFDQAMTQARLLARGEGDANQNESCSRSSRVLADDKIDLMSRAANTYNADAATASLGAGAVAPALRAGDREELTAWRDGLVKKVSLAPSSINRLMNDLRAGLIVACPERVLIGARD